MTNAQEKGHLRNATAFTELVAICSALGALYRPSNPLLALAALSDQSTVATQSVTNVMALLNDYYNAVNLRQARFNELGPLSSRIMSYFRSCGASDERIKDLRAYHRKLQGAARRSSAETTPDAVATSEATPPRSISTSQLSYDQKAQHFLSMIHILTKEPLYGPFEEDLSVAQLVEAHRQLLVLTATVQTQKLMLDKARQLRNELLYRKGNGIVDVANALKQYFKAAFGMQSVAYKQATRLSISKSRAR